MKKNSIISHLTLLLIGSATLFATAAQAHKAPLLPLDSRLTHDIIVTGTFKSEVPNIQIDRFVGTLLNINTTSDSYDNKNMFELRQIQGSDKLTSATLNRGTWDGLHKAQIEIVGEALTKLIDKKVNVEFNMLGRKSYTLKPGETKTFMMDVMQDTLTQNRAETRFELIIKSYLTFQGDLVTGLHFDILAVPYDTKRYRE